MLARLLYKCRYVFAVLAAVFAAALVWLWPQQPLWRSPPSVGRLIGVSTDGSIIVTSADSAVYRWDALTGRQVSRVEMQCAFAGPWLRPSADGLRAMVFERTSLTVPGAIPSPSGRPQALVVTGDDFLHDGLTGKRLTGPMSMSPRKGAFGSMPFSADGRWLFHDQFICEDICIFSALDGMMVLSRPKRDGYNAQCLIATDGSSVATVQTPSNNEAKENIAISIIELPSGKERCSCELPRRPSFEIDRWDGKLLHAHLTEQSDNGVSKQVSYLTIDPSSDPPAEARDPMLIAKQDFGKPPRYCLDGTDSVAYVRILSVPEMTELRPWYQDLRHWIGRRINMPYSLPSGVHVNVHVVDRKTKATTFESPQPLRHPVMVSPSGRLLACTTDDNGIAVWDTADPGPRWPWSLAVGLSVFGILWLLSRIRWRRSSRQVVEAAL